MIPVLFPASETAFASHGIGDLVDAISCSVDMKDEQYELSMEYPVDGSHFADIGQNKFILAKPNQTDYPQPFRVYRITKPIKGRVTVYGRHLGYDLSGIPVQPFKATSASDFATKLTANVLVTCPFTFQTDIVKTEDLEFDYPMSAREMIIQWAETYGGELVFDKYTVRLVQSAGQNRGVVIRYGVDLVDATMEENISSCATGIVPYYLEAQSKHLVVGSVLNAQGTFDHVKIIPVDVSDYIVSTNPSVQDVDAVGLIWLDENSIGRPEMSLKLSYAQIGQTVRQGDTITVKVERMGIDVLAKVTQTVYDVIKERYTSVNVGDIRDTFAADIYDASRLKTGLLDLKRIKDKSITGGKMASGSVGERVIADDSVSVWKLQDHAVTEDKILDGSVTQSKIPNGSILRDKISQEFEDAIADIEDKVAGRKLMKLNATQIKLNGRQFVIDRETGAVMATKD